MLTPQPAQELKRSQGRIGVALAGGGPLGAFFELGALHALEEAIDGLDMSDVDIYVGVSSGAIIAASLANGVTTSEMGRVFVTHEADDHVFQPGMFLKPAVGEYLRGVGRIPKLLFRGLVTYAQKPWEFRLAAALNPLNEAIPTGLFDNQALEAYLRKVYTSHGRSNDFRKLQNKLFVVATDLNTGRSVKFGAERHDHVPISRAVQASSALPGLFPPAEIDDSYYVDGALRRTMNASLALEEGADFVICVNPLVPFDAVEADQKTIKHKNLMDGGLPVVLSQTFRAMIQSRMQVGMAKYESGYPEADVLLFEPDRHDEEMFFANVFSYADRRRMVDHAYQSTRKDLLNNLDTVEPMLARHGYGLRMDLLEDPDRRFETQLNEERTRKERAPVVNTLSDTLEKLEELIG